MNETICPCSCHTLKDRPVTCSCQCQSEKPQPEQWCEELEMYKKSATEAIMTFDPKHTFCTICGTDPEKLITHLKEVLGSVLLAQKEQMLEVVKDYRNNMLCIGCSSVSPVGTPHREACVAISDVEEKLKAL